MRIKIEKSGINGEGIGYWQQKPIFISSCLPQEVVEVSSIETKDRYSIAVCERIIEPSSHRVTPRCDVQEKCQGCPLMIADLAYQRSLKLQNLKQTLLKYMGNFDFRLLRPMQENPMAYGYRNAMKVPVRLQKGKLVAGFYLPNSNHFQAIERCIVHQDFLDRTKVAILVVLNKHHMEDFDSNGLGLRTLVLRSFENKVQCTLVTGKMTLSDAIVDDLMQIPGLVSLYQSINTDRHTVDPLGKELVYLKGETHLDFNFANLTFKLHPRAFFQLNEHQARLMFEEVVRLVPPQKEVLDVYCGVGALTMMLAAKAKQVIGIETIQDSIDSARVNAQLNGIQNIDFRCEDAASALSKINLKSMSVVVDPPRSGLDDAMIRQLLKNTPQQLVYVSCNPSTLAKNLGELKKRFTIESIKAFDVFSHTALTEVIVNLKRID